MSTDLEWYARDEVVDNLKEQRQEIESLRAEVRVLDDRTGALARQFALVRLTIAGGDDEFWSLERDGEGHDIVGRLEQYEATLDGSRNTSLRIKDRPVTATGSSSGSTGVTRSMLPSVAAGSAEAFRLDE